MESSRIDAAAIIGEPRRLVLHHTLDDVPAEQWDALTGDNPFMKHAFLQAMHDSGCASTSTGWTPLCLSLQRDDRLVGALLLYVKRHSRGEYVFDHAWADAYMRHGMLYYPKLLAAVPFTPVAGPRLLAHTDADRLTLAEGAIALAKQNGLSSVHMLFTQAQDLSVLKQAGYMVREGVQFHWHNRHYADMSEFLSSMSKDKRKKILQDRKRVMNEGVTFQWLRGEHITADDLDFFYDCYVTTYHEHGNAPYLTRDAFERIHQALPDGVLLIIARQHGERVACAMDVVHRGTVYGRYWGALRFISGLHFETCYMQSIEFCITHGQQVFEGGAQGEHKIARGLLPVATHSAHWVGDPRFADAIADFLDQETRAVNAYRDVLDDHTPFKKTLVLAGERISRD